MDTSGVEIRLIDDKKGRGLFAKKYFNEGDVLFEEEPLVCCQFSWNSTYGYKACDHCLRPLETAQENVARLTGTEMILPYVQCCTTNKDSIVACSTCGVEYCCIDCQTKAFNTYHKTLCLQSKDMNAGHPLSILNEQWKRMHFPPESNTIMLIPRIISTINQAANPDAMLAQFMLFCHRSVSENAELVHKFLGSTFANDVSILYGLLEAALSGVTGPNSSASQLMSPDGFNSLLALIGTNSQGVGTSAVSQWVDGCGNLELSDEDREAVDRFIDRMYEDLERRTGTDFLNNEGVALFSLQSTMNHSCDPNAECTYRHNCSRVSVVAIRPIAEGEEININYLSECTALRSRHSRQRKLREHYLFVCDCAKCVGEADQPDVTSDEEEEEDEDVDSEQMDD